MTLDTRDDPHRGGVASDPPYAFRRRLESVHRTDRRDPCALPVAGEVVIDSTWQISVSPSASELERRAAYDLADYFTTSMGEPVGLTVGVVPPARSIRLSVDPAQPDHASAPARSYTLDVGAELISLTGKDDRGAAQAVYFLEDLLNLRTGPYLTPQRITRTPRFSPRMTHSGWGLDEFPDAYLSQIAHAGMDSILIFAAGPDRTPDERTNRHPEQLGNGRHMSFAAIADRAAAYGLDVYLYAYFHADRPVHPDAPGAAAHYEDVYGAVVRACPQAKGIILVGESVEFPSRDPRTTGRTSREAAPDGLPNRKPNPGWWPCSDYPQWVELVRDVCRKHNPDFEVVLWTYNWGWAPEEDRLALLHALPSDITVQATFEMFEPIEHDGVTNACVDYTASFAGPGRYFASEARVAHERGIRLFTMANTGGLTWDFGVIPYQPIPQQWSRRHKALVQAQKDWGLVGLMESHHYGWWPSFVSDLAKWAYWRPDSDATDVLRRIAARDFGSGAEAALHAWALWSEAATHYVPTVADQYGPFRIGPAYPLTLFAVPKLPVDDDAVMGDLIVSIPYRPDGQNTVPTTPNAFRIHAEIASLERMLALWQSGERELARATAAAPAHRNPAARELACLAAFIRHSIRTTIHVKRWWHACAQLQVCDDPSAALDLVNKLATIGRAERTNAEDALHVVNEDSRLGWEPTMGYVGDAAHVRWKLAHLGHVLDYELPSYRAQLTDHSAKDSAFG